MNNLNIVCEGVDPSSLDADCMEAYGERQYQEFLNERLYSRHLPCLGCNWHLCADCTDTEPEEEIEFYLDADGDVCGRPKSNNNNINNTLPRKPVNFASRFSPAYEPIENNNDAFSNVSLLSRATVETSIKDRARLRTSIAFVAAAAFSLIGSIVFIHSAFAHVSPMERCQEVASFDTCFTALNR